jgi:hypothetical protein
MLFDYTHFRLSIRDPKCFHLPLWVVLLTSVSLILMIINSSVNFFIYCVFNSTFRNIVAANSRDICSRANSYFFAESLP